VLERTNSDQLVYVYTGSAQALMGQPAEFLAKALLLERNVVIFRDVYRAFYHKGISTAIDTFEKFLEWQKAFVKRSAHVRTLFCVGTSAGAYAALLFGHLLGAEEVWAFGPPTDISGRRVVAEAGVPQERADLAVLLKASNGRTRYNVYYNESYEPDRISAVRLAACDRVALWPQPGDGHQVVRTLLERDQLSTLLPPP
jgi:hypothetical protein